MSAFSFSFSESGSDKFFLPSAASDSSFISKVFSESPVFGSWAFCSASSCFLGSEFSSFIWLLPASEAFSCSFTSSSRAVSSSVISSLPAGTALSGSFTSFSISTGTASSVSSPTCFFTSPNGATVIHALALPSTRIRPVRSFEEELVIRKIISSFPLIVYWSMSSSSSKRAYIFKVSRSFFFSKSGCSSYRFPSSNSPS